MEHEAGHAGLLRAPWRRDQFLNLAGLRGGQTPNFYNQYAAFLLGLTSQVSKAIQWEDMKTRECRAGGATSA